jgi:plasmid stabilization system protein ParE
VTYRVEVSAAALDSIREYVRFIAVKRKAPLSAERWLETINRAIDSLASFPTRCPLAPEDRLVSYEVRSRIVGDYLILSNVDEAAKKVYVIGFRHGRRRPRHGKLPSEPPSS